MRRQIIALPSTPPGHANVAKTLKRETHIDVQLGDILPALTDALLSQRVWIRDFADDQISISKDFYEVIMAFEQMNRAA